MVQPWVAYGLSKNLLSPGSCQQPWTTRRWQHWPWPLCLLLQYCRRKLGGVGHIGFKPPGNLLSIEKFLLSSQSLWLIATIRGMSQNPTCDASLMWVCWEGCLDSALKPHCTNITVHTFKSYLLILDEELRQNFSFLGTRTVWSRPVDNLLPIQMHPHCARSPEYPPLAQFYLDEILFYFSFYFAEKASMPWPVSWTSQSLK